MEEWNETVTRGAEVSGGVSRWINKYVRRAGGGGLGGRKCGREGGGRAKEQMWMRRREKVEKRVEVNEVCEEDVEELYGGECETGKTDWRRMEEDEDKGRKMGGRDGGRVEK